MVGSDVGNGVQPRARNPICVDLSSRFEVRCKTLEFENRLTLPNRALPLFGIKNRRVLIECGHTAIRFKCRYQCRRIKTSGNLMLRLGRGWKGAAVELKVQQGDTLVFDQCNQVPFKFHVSVKKHPDAVLVDPKVEPEYWV